LRVKRHEWFGPHAVARNPGGARNREHACQCERPRNEAFIDRGTRADAAVEALFGQIDHAVVQVQVHLHLRIGRDVLGNDRCEPVSAIGDGRCHAQHALRHGAQRLGHAVGRVHAREHVAATLQVGRADFRECVAPRGALEQASAELILKCADVLADHHSREIERLGGRGKAARIHRGDEDFHRAQLVHIENSEFRIA
jgi:hypothetical protein